MGNAIVIEEKRGVIQKFREWYKNKVVDTGYSATAEDILHMGVEGKKAVDKVIIKGLEIGLSFYPDAADAIPLLPTIQKMSEKTTNIMEKATIGTKRFIEAKLIGVDGSSKDVNLPDVNVKEYVQDVVGVISDVNNIGKTEENEEEIVDEIEENKGRTL